MPQWSNNLKNNIVGAIAHSKLLLTAIYFTSLYSTEQTPSGNGSPCEAGYYAAVSFNSKLTKS